MEIAILAAVVFIVVYLVASKTNKTDEVVDNTRQGVSVICPLCELEHDVGVNESDLESLNESDYPYLDGASIIASQPCLFCKNTMTLIYQNKKIIARDEKWDKAVYLHEHKLKDWEDKISELEDKISFLEFEYDDDLSDKRVESLDNRIEKMQENIEKISSQIEKEEESFIDKESNYEERCFNWQQKLADKLE